MADVFLVCYSVANPTSFDNAKEKWIPEIRHYSPNTPFILVGTQEDLRDDPSTIEELRRMRHMPVTHEQGQKLAKTVRAARFVECSALTQKGLKNVFDEAIITVVNKDYERGEKKTRRCTLL